MLWTKLLNLFKVRWKAVLVFCGFVAIGLFIWYGQSMLKDWGTAIAEREQLVQTVNKQNKQIEKLLKETRKTRELLNKRNKNILQIKKEIESIPYEVDKTIEIRTEIKDWTNSTVPRAVIDSLRSKSPNSNKNKNQTNNTSNDNGQKG